MYLEDTIAAVATPPGEGGISIIRISGRDALPLAEKVFSAKGTDSLSKLPGYTARYGDFVNNGETIDSGVALVYHAPKSYTGEDVAELMCHGGEIVSAALLRAVLDAGARPALGGEFTKRAFLNGKLTLTEAEAVCDIITAGSRGGAKAAVSASRGALYRETEKLKGELLKAAAHISAEIDYPEEDVEPVESEKLLETLSGVCQRLEDLISGYERGEAALRGVSAAIVGTPNVGKSTLLNLLAGYERAIVTPTPGTTRDVVEVRVRLGETAIILSDTAGIRQSDDEIESAGIELALGRIESSQLVLAVFDGSRPLTEDDRRVIQSTQGKTAIAIVNKTDLPPVADCAEIEAAYPETVYISAKDSASAALIDSAVARRIGLGEFDTNAPMLANERQRAAAVSAHRLTAEAVSQLTAGTTLDIVENTVFEAHKALCELSGENASEAVIDEVFSRFCVGK